MSDAFSSAPVGSCPANGWTGSSLPFSQSGVFQEDLYPLTAGDQASMTAQDWLLGIDGRQYLLRNGFVLVRCSSPPSVSSPPGPVLMSLKPGTQVANPYPETSAERELLWQQGLQTDRAVATATGTELDPVEEVRHQQALAQEEQRVIITKAIRI